MPCEPQRPPFLLGLIAAGVLLLAGTPAASTAAPPGQVWGIALPNSVKSVKQSQLNWLAGRRVTTIVAVRLPQK